METESALEHGLLLFNKDNNYTFELLITTRIGMEMLFDKDILPVVKAKRKMEAKGMLMASSVVFFSSC